MTTEPTLSFFQTGFNGTHRHHNVYTILENIDKIDVQKGIVTPAVKRKHSSFGLQIIK